MPLLSKYWLSKKPRRQAWLEPVVDHEARTWSFAVRTGEPNDKSLIDAGLKEGRGTFRCLLSGAVIPNKYIKEQGTSGCFGQALLGMVLEGKRRRLYVSANSEHQEFGTCDSEAWSPTVEFAKNSRHLTPFLYGLTNFGDLFTNRQRNLLNAISDVMKEVARIVAAHAPSKEYADALTTLLCLGVTRRFDRWTNLSIWDTTRDTVVSLIRMNAIPMSWDFAEVNPFSNSSGNMLDGLRLTALAVEKLPALGMGTSFQQSATDAPLAGRRRVISTDPPYYDNIPYADLSDFFYIWQRRMLSGTYPELYRTMQVPKAEELVADSFRHGSTESAGIFFLNGMSDALCCLAEGGQDFPITIYYAFKESELRKEGVASTGWQVFLQAVLDAGLMVVGTWPIRTEAPGGLRVIGRNALATSVVLVCRKRPEDAPIATRQDFLRDLRSALPVALTNLQRSNLAPVDLAQSSIGPGMAVFSKYCKVIEADGPAMTVRSALQLINQVLDESLGAEEGQLDGDTRFAVTWFESHQYKQGPFGEADNLARARTVSVAGVAEAGVLQSAAGQVRLFTRPELPAGWDPAEDKRLTVWEATQYLIKRLEEEGEQAAAALLKDLGATVAGQARNLAYRLYTICERKKWAEEARAYNGLVLAWLELEKLAARNASTATETQSSLGL